IFLNYFSGRTCGTFLDIGANIGLTTLPVAQYRQVHCHAFEPDPETFDLLQENVSTNAGPNVMLYNIALFSDEMSLTLALSASNRGNHMIQPGAPNESSVRSPQSRGKMMTVSGDRLDRILDIQELRTPLAIKIDAEGSEYHIYQGGRNI